MHQETWQVVMALATGIAIGIAVGWRWAKAFNRPAVLAPPTAPIAPAPKGTVVPLARLGDRRRS